MCISVGAVQFGTAGDAGILFYLCQQPAITRIFHRCLIRKEAQVAAEVAFFLVATLSTYRKRAAIIIRRQNRILRFGDKRRME